MKKLLLLIIWMLLIPMAHAYDFDDWDTAEEAFSTGIVRMESEPLDGDILKISVLAEEITTPVLGIAFYLNFDQESLAFLKYEPGDFLERGGDPFYMVKNKDGKIIFGEVLRRDDNFPLGKGTIVDFYFQILDRKDLSFEFERGVVSTLDTVRQDLNEITWENLYIDKDGKEKSGGFPEGAISTIHSSDLEAKIPDVSSKFWIVGLIILAIGGLLFLVIFVKKQGNKRHINSVNFK